MLRLAGWWSKLLPTPATPSRPQPTSWNIVAAGSRLQLGVVRVCGREDGLAEPGDAGRVEGLLPVDQKSGDGVAGGIKLVSRGRMLRLIDQALESRWRSIRGVDVRSHHARPLKFKHDFSGAHRAIALGVFAVAGSAVPPAPALGRHRRRTVATSWERVQMRMARFSGHHACHGDDVLAGKCSQPKALAHAGRM
jgi:hypothetical protein